MPFELLNESTLEELAGERAFDRGVDYFEEGHVAGIKEQNGVITARVRGIHEYYVKLWAPEAELAFDCNCPVGQDGVFCKHCVAVGLAWLDRCEHKGGASQRQSKRAATDEEIRSHLMQEDKDALIEFMLEQCERDPEFRDRLVLLAAHKGEDGPDLAAFRAAIVKAIRHRGFVEYARMPAHASANYSEIVRVYLWEGNPDSVWAEAKHGGCCDSLWFQLAEAREKDHPEDAVAVYGEQLTGYQDRL